ncbi:hypothetical protein [Trinickia terrae]|uniref:hypothetical protein n=1 Tax=Trinickia terrae TaxID=2571161 RepID=UPI001F0F2CB3|nr:hypothetical protein [Trinickia terrae]
MLPQANAQIYCTFALMHADNPHFQGLRVVSRALPGYKAEYLFRRAVSLINAMLSAKFYFYFFWYLRPLADREE